MNYVFTHVNLITGEEDRDVIEDMHVYVKDDKIVALEQGNSPVRDSYQTVDARGRYLMPGLINLHAHLFGTGKPSKTLGGGRQQKMVVSFASTRLGGHVLDKMLKENMEQALYSGVTTVRGVGDLFYSDVRLRDRIEKGTALGPRLLVSGPAVTVPGGHGDGTFAVTSADPAGIRQLVAQNAKHRVDLIKICVTGGVMDAKKKGEPGELKMSLEQTKAACEEAHRLGYKVASHTESPEGVIVALKGGVDTVEHGSLLDQEAVELFQERKSALICTLSPALPLASLPPSKTKLNELCVYNSRVILDNMVEGVKTALAHDIPVGLGTDASCPFATQYNMWRELWYFKTYAGVSNEFAVHTATLKNAQILGIDEITGSIAPGKSADLIVLKENPYKDLRALRSVDAVMVRGRLTDCPKVKKNEEIEAELDSLMKGL
ncbi:amidohydrolase family protein [Lachnotalea sp. AF33-28]|uniref:amidohydrolase family protein n=1 Tax=Lachnotalea sp. AF33-28 TaxID=2292046 RepID=UPI00131502E2|nr:amidohydrolase family protein [Lachnotalea sp. AF33-28]